MIIRQSLLLRVPNQLIRYWYILANNLKAAFRPRVVCCRQNCLRRLVSDRFYVFSLWENIYAVVHLLNVVPVDIFLASTPVNVAKHNMRWAFSSELAVQPFAAIPFQVEISFRWTMGEDNVCAFWYSVLLDVANRRILGAQFPNCDVSGLLNTVMLLFLT